MINNINDLMKSVELEYNMNKITQRMNNELILNEAYMEFIDKKYENKLRDLQLVENVRRRMVNLTILITQLKDIEHQAIVIKDMELYWKCEQRIAKMINQMEILRSKYDL
jgi:hypothetical protein